MSVTNTMAALAAAVVLGIADAAWAVPGPEVTNVRMAYQPGAKTVDVWYDLTNEAAIVTLRIETNGVVLPFGAVTRLSGDVSVVVQPGTDKHIVWNARADWPENRAEMTKARVTAWSTNSPPLYCVLDLSGGYATNWYPVAYYESAEALPDGGLTNDLYRLDRLVMRRIRTKAASPENGVFIMGSPTSESYRDAASEDRHQVTLTNDYYMCVYEVTQWQWNQVMNARPSGFTHPDYWRTRPVEEVSYHNIRGASNAVPMINWPLTGSAVASNSFVGKLWLKTSVAGVFDLPTEAQWEYACRAGKSDCALYDGTVNLTGQYTDARVNLLGRYVANGGFINGTTPPSSPTSTNTTANGTAKVGTYVPNTWGLYDMNGNAKEWCRDWYTNSLGTAAVTDPGGPASGSARAMRGGCWYNGAYYLRSAGKRETSGPSNASDYTYGFRFVLVLP